MLFDPVFMLQEVMPKLIAAIPLSLFLLITSCIIGNLMAVPVATSPTFSAGQTRALFSTSGFTVDGFHTSFELTPDGRQFLFPAPRQATSTLAPPSLVRVDHWFRELEARMKQ